MKSDFGAQQRNTQARCLAAIGRFDLGFLIFPFAESSSQGQQPIKPQTGRRYDLPTLALLMRILSMPLTTPLRPHDLLERIPELANLARQAVRLHPREDSPGIDESSIGGPLLWPLEEAWPVCRLAHDPIGERPFGQNPRLRITKEDRRRFESRTGTFDPDRDREEEQELAIRAVREAHSGYDPSDPVPLIPVAQLYYRDVPGLPWPDRFDLLQILWCPLNHTGSETITPYCPAFQVRWRRVAEVGAALAEPPTPVMCVDEYLPNPCAVHPEIVTEYPNYDDLPEDLQEAVEDWECRIGDGTSYSSDLALAPGWKAMGHGGCWSLYEPYPVTCECGTEQLPLFTAASGEFDAGTKSWQPVEEAATGWSLSDPVGAHFGRGDTFQLYSCPESELHANRTEMF
jgi:hypothetical protein